MNNQNQNPIPSPNPAPEPPPGPGNIPPNEPQDWREQRRRERWARREARWQGRTGRHSGWILGALLILVGLALLLQQLNIATFANWWALFILIPAFWAFVAAWNRYQAVKKLTGRAVGALVVGILLTLVALAFLFNYYPLASFFWPALLLLGGLAFLVTALIRE
jgi:peptidoglycan/LPS O-acetylase OafA/YrhL